MEYVATRDFEHIEDGRATSGSRGCVVDFPRPSAAARLLALGVVEAAEEKKEERPSGKALSKEAVGEDKKGE